jgi:hypothetical protein
MEKRRNVGLPWLIEHVVYLGDECLEWPFTKGTNGYGWLAYQGRGSNASRVMCILAHGEPPNGAVALHSCDNKPCVNPRHLRWGTQSENMTETYSRKLRQSKLSPSDREKIRSLAGVMPKSETARRYGVSRAAVWKIQKGK